MPQGGGTSGNSEWMERHAEVHSHTTSDGRLFHWGSLNQETKIDRMLRVMNAIQAAEEEVDPDDLSLRRAHSLFQRWNIIIIRNYI